jgi:hypothetical protein
MPDEEVPEASGTPDVNRGPTYPFNDEFTSNRREDVLRFYEHFRSQNELITWMRNRPSGRAVITEVEGRKDLIVVIPTADIQGPMATRCRAEIFKGQHIIFVESGRIDPFFNYARNVNTGVRRALEHNPKWIIVSNDDMVQRDSIEVLIDSLAGLDDGVDVVYGPASVSQHQVQIGRPRPLVRAVLTALYSIRYPNAAALLALEARRGPVLGLENWFIWNTPGGIGRFVNPLMYAPNPDCRPFLNSGSFGVYSSRIVKEWTQPPRSWLDETYINAYEDFDLALRLDRAGARVGLIKFEIGTIGGASLGGKASVRQLREFAGLVYFNYKLRSGLMNVSMC